ncbi:MAG: hypothetical protein K0M50_02860 [Prolixibacteraceae bacterium]|nr:hypothetical protein [Prolixibacteraceae bacterium]
MRITITVIAVLFSFQLFGQGKGYINYLLIHTEVNNSRKEHEIQKKAKNNEALVMANESVNKKTTSEFQEKYKKVKSRLNSLGILIDGAKFLYDAIPLVSSIKDSQEQIFEMVKDHPKFIPIAILGEEEFIIKASSVVTFIAGLCLSVGDLNQMEPANRKILLDFAISELRHLDGMCLILKHSLNTRIIMDNAGLLKNWVTPDKKIVDDILRNIKNF